MARLRPAAVLAWAVAARYVVFELGASDGSWTERFVAFQREQYIFLFYFQFCIVE